MFVLFSFFVCFCFPFQGWADDEEDSDEDAEDDKTFFGMDTDNDNDSEAREWYIYIFPTRRRAEQNRRMASFCARIVNSTSYLVCVVVLMPPAEVKPLGYTST